MDYQKLYRHMAIEHGLFLLDSQMQEIVSVVLEMDDQKLFNHMYDEHDLLLLQSQKQEIVDIVLEMHNEKPETCTESIERQYKEKGNQLDQVYGAIKEPSNNDQMKTAMQELIDDLKEFRDEQTSPLVISTMNKVLLKASLLLTKEKEQLEKAWQDGAETAQNDAAKEIRNNYTPNKL